MLLECRHAVSRCQAENPGRARFCEECGAQFARSCPHCRAEVLSGKNFCWSCGGQLADRATDGVPPPVAYTPKHLAERILTSKAALEGERKQVTVLFADLKGSMELLADRDPEEARKHPRPGARADDGGRPSLRGHGQPGDGRRDHGAVRRAARPRGSRRARLLRRAPHAGGGAAATPRRCGARRASTSRSASGSTRARSWSRSIGSDLRMDYTAVGQTTHLAARMEQLATPGTILLTRRHAASGRGLRRR